MRKIEVGMYAYVKGKCRDYGIGIIKKFEWDIKEPQVEIQFKNAYRSITQSEIEASFDVTDLIKVGDVIAIKENIDNFAQVFILGIYEPQLLNEIKSKIDRNELILDSVLTKEQFESVKYEVE